MQMMSNYIVESCEEPTPVHITYKFINEEITDKINDFWTKYNMVFAWSFSSDTLHSIVWIHFSIHFTPLDTWQTLDINVEVA